MEGNAQAEFSAMVFKNEKNQELPYRILYPENYDKSKQYPLILFLHGSGERGTDNEKQLGHGSKLFLEPKNRTNFPAIVIFPQCPEDIYWASVKIKKESKPLEIDFTYEKDSNWPLQSALDLVHQFVKNALVDKERVYIIGLSMGGMGTFEALYRKPNLFAAAIAICGGAAIEKAPKYSKKVAIWIFHGAKDSVVKPRFSYEIYARLEELNANVKYTEYPDADHNSWENAFAEPDLLTWLFSNSK